MLATEFERAIDEVIVAVEKCSDEEWRRVCPDEGWTVGVIVHHIAAMFPRNIAATRALIGEGEMPAEFIEGWDSIHKVNAEHVAQHAECGHEETLALLRQNAETAAAFIRDLTDEGLDRSGFYPLRQETRTGQQMVKGTLIGHPRMHLPGIRAALGK